MKLNMFKRVLSSVVIMMLMFGIVFANATYEHVAVKAATKSDSASKTVIVLDPGHDSTHEGSTANSLSESALALKIANYCKEELLQYEGVEVYMSRESAACPHKGTTSGQCNSARVDYAASVKADYYVSFHLNENSSVGANGAEVFYPNTNGNAAVSAKGKTLAGAIEDKLAALGLKKRGISTRDSLVYKFDDGTPKDYYGVIRWAKDYSIAGIIIEHCFQSNTSDVSKYLSTNAKLKSLGVADANGIVDALGLTKAAVTTSVSAPQAPVISTLYATNTPKVKIAWDKISGADGYIVYRSTSKSSGFKKIKKIKSQTTNSYTDASVSSAATYYYKVKAYVNDADGNAVKSKASAAQSVDVMSIPVITGTNLASNGIKLKWDKVEGATGYIIYASDTRDGTYTRIKKINSADKLKYNDKTLADGQIRYYKIRAYDKQLGKTVKSKASDSWLEIGGFYTVIGESNATVDDMVAYFKNSGATYPKSTYKKYGAATLKKFCKIVYDEATAEGVRSEVVFAQICCETGFLKFGGSVKAKQCNFGGLGAVAGSKSTVATFADVQTGIRAQVQHLKAYGNKKALVNEVVDGRFSYVSRGSAKYIEYLSIPNNPSGVGWATNTRYGTTLLTAIKAMCK